MEDIFQAGKIAAKAVQYAKKILEPGKNLLEIAEKIENFIIKEGGKPGFPVNISINEVAAHYTPDTDEKTVLKEGDVVKIDIGVQINGYVADTAFTVEIGTDRYKNLIEAAEKALQNVIKTFRKGIELWEIGDTIEKTIKSFGFNPIYNLCGHKIEQYILHAGISIPNYNNRCKIKIEKGIYAVEPFATNGKGYVKDSKPSGIFKLERFSIPRDRIAREIYEYIEKNYKTLPFAKRWLVKVFGKTKTEYALSILKRLGIVYEYPVLVEVSNGIVTQFEHTFYIKDDKVYVVTL